MARPKSTITGRVGTSVRLTDAQRIAFRRLGGGKWLRALLDKAQLEMEKQNARVKN